MFHFTIMGASYLAIAAGFNFGSTLTSLPVEVIDHMAKYLGFDDENPTIVAIMETTLPVGGALGMCFISLVSERVGLLRSITLLFAAQIVFTSLCAVPLTWWYTAAIRFLCGFCTSGLASLAPLLVAQECEPAKRARTMVFYSVALNVSILTSYTVHFLVSYDYHFWGFMFLPSALVCLSALIVAIKYAKQYRVKRTGSTTMDVLQIDGTYGDAQQQEQDHGAQTFPESSNTFARTETEETSNTFVRRHQNDTVNMQKLTKGQFARMVYVTIALAIMQIWTGEDIILVYTTELFKYIFDSPKSGIYGSLIFGAFQLVGSIVIAPIAERKKRRTMLLIGVIGCALVNLLIALTYIFKLSNYLLIVLILLFTIFFLIGPEPIVFMLFSEMYPEKYKVKLNGLAYAVNWTATIVQIFVFEYFVGGLEQYIFLIFAFLTAVLGISGTILAPETHQKTLVEIELQIRAWGKKKSNKTPVEVEVIPDQSLQMADFSVRRIAEDKNDEDVLGDE